MRVPGGAGLAAVLRRVTAGHVLVVFLLLSVYTRHRLHMSTGDSYIEGDDEEDKLLLPVGGVVPEGGSTQDERGRAVPERKVGGSVVSPPSGDPGATPSAALDSAAAGEEVAEASGGGHASREEDPDEAIRGALSSMGLDEMLFAASEGSGGGADADEAARIDDAMAKAREAHVARKAALMRAQKADTWLSSAPPAAGKRRFGGVGVGKADERDTGGFINFAGAMKVSKTVANKEGMHRAGQLLIPKFDNPAGERIWPPPEIRLRGDPKDRDFKWDWAKARGSYWRKFMDVIPEHELTRNWTYGTCAVVGNGGSLTMWDLGEEIDSHDAVIRFNRGPTAGFQKHVGNRTTVRIVNRNNLGTIHDGDEAVLQHVTAPEAFRAFVKFREEDRDKPVYAIDPEFHKDVLQWYMKWLTASGARTNDQSPATNGFYGIIFAVQRCQRISLYGFARLWGAGRHNEGAAFPMQLPYHYFDEEEPRGMQKTRDDIEMKVLRHLVNTRKQSVRFAEPCGSGCERECERCPPGGQCMCDIWHPVPIAGFCLSPSSQHRANKGVLRGVMDCFHKCVDRHACPGGVHGICPGDTSLYRTECATFEDLVQ